MAASGLFHFNYINGIVPTVSNVQFSELRIQNHPHLFVGDIQRVTHFRWTFTPNDNHDTLIITKPPDFKNDIWILQIASTLIHCPNLKYITMSKCIDDTLIVLALSSLLTIIQETRPDIIIQYL